MIDLVRKPNVFFFFCKVAGTWMSQKAILDQLLLGNKKRKEFEK
jgi:hypothetical protein